MPITGEAKGQGSFADTSMRAWIGREAEDVPPGWMDNVVKRMLEQVNRQLIRVEDAKEEEDNTPESRDMNSRALARLQLTMDRLVRLETQRSKSRATTKAIAAHGSALEELKRRLDQLTAARSAGNASGASE
jgi:hypothetical protein